MVGKGQPFFILSLIDVQNKTGKLLTSHRSTAYPCYLPILGEFCRSWPYKTCRGANI